MKLYLITLFYKKKPFNPILLGMRNFEKEMNLILAEGNRRSLQKVAHKLGREQVTEYK